MYSFFYCDWYYLRGKDEGILKKNFVRINKFKIGKDYYGIL